MSIKLDTPSRLRIARSFEHKSTLVQLATLIGAFGLYGLVAGLMLARGVHVLVAYVPIFIITIVVLIMLMSAGHILALLGDKPARPDERDLAIQWRSESRGGWILGTGVVLVICGLIAGCEPVWAVHGLLAIMFVSECATLFMQIRAHSRGLA
jgi:hypothetical protein